MLVNAITIKMLGSRDKTLAGCAKRTGQIRISAKIERSIVKS